jgi:YD repeat-containing protein
MFEGASGFGDEQLKGTPKMVTVEREKLGDQPLLQPEEQSTYREDGKLSSRKRYVDGKLVSKEIFEYDAQGHRTAITTYDAEEKLTRTQSFRRLLDESEEEIDSAGRKQQSRTIRRFDSVQRVIELKSIETSNVTTIMQFDYDDRGRPLEARIQMASEITMRLALTYPGDNQAVVTLYDAAGKILLQLETTEDGAGNEMAQILFQREPQNKPATSTRVDHVDAQENWTLKTLLERNPRTQVDEAVARLHRSIVYY